MNAHEFNNAIELANRGVFIKRGDVVRELAQHVAEQKLTDSIAYLETPQGLMVSSANDEVLGQLVEWSKGKKGTEVIRRLTLEDILEQIGEHYQFAEIITTRERDGQEHQMFLTKVGDTVTARVIIDQGIRKSARVIAITMYPENSRWSVSAYALQQYATSLAGIEEDGDTVRFNVSDFAESEYEDDRRSAFDRCRDAVVEYKATGGKGEDQWVDDCAKRLVKEGEFSEEDMPAARDQATNTLTKACEKFGRVLYATGGTATHVAGDQFPLQQQEGAGRSQRSNGRSGRREQSLGKMFEGQLDRLKAAVVE